MLARYRGRLLPLAVESVMNQAVVGVDGARIGTVTTRSTGARSPTLGGKEG